VPFRRRLKSFINFNHTIFDAKSQRGHTRRKENRFSKKSLRLSLFFALNQPLAAGSGFSRAVYRVQKMWNV
jgi:hypothetical protein